MLDDFCQKNNIGNRIEYMDIGKSALAKDRKALQKILENLYIRSKKKQKKKLNKKRIFYIDLHIL